jgi:beta-lactamase class A
LARVARVLLSLMLILLTLPNAVSAAAPGSLSELQTQISARLSGWNGKYAVTVTDLQTGQTVSVNGARSQTAASTIKIFIAIGIAQQIDAGHIAKDDVDGLMQAMMGQSSNEAAYELIEMLGNGNIVAGTRAVNTVAQNLGTTGTFLDSPPDHPEIDIGIARDNLLTTNDLNLVLTKLYHGQILSPASTDYVLYCMSLPSDWQNGSVGGPLPAGSTFYHKPGWIGAPYDTWNDAGIVVVNRNGLNLAYAISYLGSFSGSEGEDYNRGYAVSDLVWSYFDAAYPAETVHYFPQTGHSVGHGFLNYWRKNGGLDVFGYPLTDEITQDPSGMGTPTTVQYFERARFEWHPGAAPDNFDVLLGLLGNELTAGQRQAGAKPFRPATANDAQGCTFFAATSHNLCGGFAAFWEQFGGLAIYGYPISEEVSQNGVIVQYFERARFEWHSGSAPDRYDVLLGRLGAEELAAEDRRHDR